MVTTRGLTALWIDAGGAMRATVWSTAGVVVDDAVTIASGPFTSLWAAASQDEIFIVAEDATGATGRILRADLTSVGVAASMVGAPFAGRAPIAARHGGGFVAITTSGAAPIVYEISDATQTATAHDVPALAGHSAGSIAVDATGYAVVTEQADQFGPGCWYTQLGDDFAAAAGPASIESTQQADCDSSIVAASAGPAGAAMAWMDRDPVTSAVGFRGTAAGSGFASGPGELDVGAPIITATSSGFATIYRSAAGLRAFDAAGGRTLASAADLADLVTWGDQAIAVWTSASAAQLTRLCP
jgi:hypothetical protein